MTFAETLADLSRAVILACLVALWSASSRQAHGQTLPVEASASGRGAEISPAEAATIAETTTTANTAPAYRKLLAAETDALVRLLQASGEPLVQATIDRARQSAAVAREAWLEGSGYDFAIPANTDADIAILSSFKMLPAIVLERNDAIVEQINHAASAAQQQHALVDADGAAYLFFLAEALGPRLGGAFLHAYESGKIVKTATLLKASEVGTGKAKSYFAQPRPFLVKGNTIRPVMDETVLKDGAPYKAAGGSFPSGHTEVGYTDGLLLAEMLPERFLPLLGRSAGYGYSRVVLGVHYPLDVIGSRMIAERNVAHYLSDPHYRVLFEAARDELRVALAAECRDSIAVCARSLDAAADPWSSVRQRDFYHFTMTYDLPRGGTDRSTMTVPAEAVVLLEALRPDLTAETRKHLLERTALASDYPLDAEDSHTGEWQRVDLYEAVLAASPPVSTARGLTAR